MPRLTITENEEEPERRAVCDNSLPLRTKMTDHRLTDKQEILGFVELKGLRRSLGEQKNR